VNLLCKACMLSVLSLSVWCNAQEKIVNIWDGAAPGTEGRKNTEYFEENKLVYNVFQPDVRIFLPSQRNSSRSAIIIFAGGGFQRIVIQKEGYKVAQWFNNHGMTAFVLKYRLNPQEALQDAQRAVSYVRTHAQEYNIDPNKIGVIGFSAGGHIVGNLITHLDRNEKKDIVDSMSCRPDFAIGVYGAYEPMRQNTSFTPFNQLVDKNTPPFFLVHAVNDNSVSYRQSLNLFNALQKAGVPSELHLFETGGHGFAFEEDRGVVKVWMDVLDGWLRVRNVIP
jgi:acetyl esterase/lipase